MIIKIFSFITVFLQIFIFGNSLISYCFKIWSDFKLRK